MLLNDDELRLAVAMAEVAIRAEKEFMESGSLSARALGRSRNLIKKMITVKNKFFKSLTGKDA